MDVYGFLSFQIELAEAKDDVSRQLLTEEAPSMPEEYLLVRKLRSFSSGHGNSHGGVPFLVEGAWYDQPYVTCLIIEAAIAGERRFEASLNTPRVTGSENSESVQ